MRRQWKLDVKERPLKIKEKRILKEIEHRSRLKIPARAVMYERHTPRATVCTIFLANWWDLIARRIVGVTIRSRTDTEDMGMGQEQSFRRALEDYVNRQRCK